MVEKEKPESQLAVETAEEIIREHARFQDISRRVTNIPLKYSLMAGFSVGAVIGMGILIHLLSAKNRQER